MPKIRHRSGHRSAIFHNPSVELENSLAVLQHPDNIANNPIALFKMAVIYFGTCLKGCAYTTRMFDGPRRIFLYIRQSIAVGVNNELLLFT